MAVFASVNWLGVQCTLSDHDPYLGSLTSPQQEDLLLTYISQVYLHYFLVGDVFLSFNTHLTYGLIHDGQDSMDSTLTNCSGDVSCCFYFLYP